MGTLSLPMLSQAISKPMQARQFVHFQVYVAMDRLRTSAFHGIYDEKLGRL